MTWKQLPFCQRLSRKRAGAAAHRSVAARVAGRRGRGFAHGKAGEELREIGMSTFLTSRRLGRSALLEHLHHVSAFVALELKNRHTQFPYAKSTRRRARPLRRTLCYSPTWTSVRPALALAFGGRSHYILRRMPWQFEGGAGARGAGSRRRGPMKALCRVAWMSQRGHFQLAGAAEPSTLEKGLSCP